MPRHKRLNVEGGIYHVITRGIERRAIFEDDKDREKFLRRLEEGLVKTDCQCLAWSLMSNHIHLLIRTGEKALSDLMRKLLTGYAIYFNHKYKRHGYLYQNRYKSILCEADVYFLELVRYIHLNPVRAKIITEMHELDKYPWAGHSAIIGKVKRDWQEVDEVLSHLAEKENIAKEKYRKFILDGWGMKERDDLEGGGLKRSVGGWEGVELLKKNKERWRSDERILGTGDFVAGVLKSVEEKMKRKSELKHQGWNFDKLIKRITDYFKIHQEEMQRKRRKPEIARAKNVLAYLGNQELGISCKELCNFFHMTLPSLSTSINKGKRWIEENNVNLLF